MLKKYLLSGTLAALCAGIGVSAQTSSGGQQPYPQQPTTGTQNQPRSEQATTTTLTGCVYREADVPGRTPNVAEKAGVLEDYILAEVRMAGQQTTPSPGATTGTSGTTGSMYKLEKVDDERLRAMVGKRVEVTGRIDREPGDAPDRPAGTRGTTTPPESKPDRSAGPDRINLPEFEVTSIKEVSGTCPPKPAGRQ